MSIRLHPKHGVAPMMEICAYSGYATGNLLLLGDKCSKYIDKHGNLPRFMVTGNVHPRILEVLEKGGVCILGPEQFQCVVMTPGGAAQLFESQVLGKVVKLKKEAWDDFLTRIPPPASKEDGSHVGKDFPAFPNDAESTTETDTPAPQEIDEPKEET